MVQDGPELLTNPICSADPQSSVVVSLDATKKTISGGSTRVESDDMHLASALSPGPNGHVRREAHAA